MKALRVYLGASEVGRLTLADQRRFHFVYDENWVASSGSQSLSFSLPIRAEAYANDESRAFFANLLPEANVRRALAAETGISVGNDFDLLAAVGGECAGAVSLWPDSLPRPESGSYDSVSLPGLEKMVTEMPNRTFLMGPAGRKGYRLSLAGAQAKIPVMIFDGKIFLPRGSFSSTHIIKPPIPNLKYTVENELFCMRLAGIVGLGVSSSTLIGQKMRSFMTERYDRVREGKDVQRLHQEDFCQALGILPDGKYEAEGGPTLKDCFKLVSDWSSEPAVDRLRLLRWVIFNLVIGNADAHGKNLSFFYREGSTRLAPFYDLLNTRFYPKLSDQAAMRIGGAQKIDAVSRRNIEIFADEVEIKSRFVLETFMSFAAQIEKELPEMTKKLSDEFGKKPIFFELESAVRKRAHKLISRVK